VGFGIDRRARSRKGRGLFRKAPDARDVGERVSRLIRRSVKAGVERAGWKQERFIVELRLLDAGPLATLTVEADADLVLRGETAALGPGYHCELVARLGPLLDELELAWTEPPDDLATTQAAMCAWLAGELAAGPVQFGVPGTRVFRIADPTGSLTPLGPRDAAWRETVIAEPSRAADAFPWWDRGPGRLERARALLAMAVEVPWREPLDAAERELMKRVDDDLRRARNADAALAMPWAAWQELLVNMGAEDEDVEARAGAAPAAAPIGYRRHDLEVELSGGWSVTIPAAFVGHWEDDGARYWATDGDRMIDFSSLTADGEADSARLLAVAPEAHPVIARYDTGDSRGRAEAFVDEGVHIVVGLMASAPHVGILTCKGGDEAWKLAAWRSLRQG
jgi:hypothetical protein